jgi:DNA modification methylase
MTTTFSPVSGTTLIAAEKTGRIAYTMEIDPVYVDAAIRRWQALTDGTVFLDETGESFERVAAARFAADG